MADKNQPFWLTILYVIAMPDIYLNPGKCTRNMLKSRYEQKWHKEVSSIKFDKSTNEGSNKLRTYKTFKKNFEQENYLLLSNF